MKLNQETENREPLGELLRGWIVDAPLAPRFQESVWRRIRLLEEQKPAPLKLWTDFASWWNAVLRQPAVAAAYLTVIVAAGAGFGYWKSERYVKQTEVGWRAAYVLSVNPYGALPTK